MQPDFKPSSLVRGKSEAEGVIQLNRSRGRGENGRRHRQLNNSGGKSPPVCHMAEAGRACLAIEPRNVDSLHYHRVHGLHTLLTLFPS